jgi:hypothetical protein
MSGLSSEREAEPSPYSAADHALAARLDALQLAQPLTDGPHAEQRHFLDADGDTCVPLPGVAHPAPGGAS